MVRYQLSDYVAINYIFPPVNDDLGMGSSDNSLSSSLSNNIEFRDDTTLFRSRECKVMLLGKEDLGLLLEEPIPKSSLTGGKIYLMAT